MRCLRPALSVFLIGAVFLMAGCMGSDSGHADAAGDRLLVAPDFVLKDLNNQEVKLTELLSTHKAVLVNFWASWCPPCRAEVPDLIKLQERYKGLSFTVIGVDVGESHAKTSAFVEHAGINYPVVLDLSSAVTERYRVVGIPTSFLVGGDGKVFGEYHAVTPDLTADLEKILK